MLRLPLFSRERTLTSGFRMEGFVMIARAHQHSLSPNRTIALLLVIGAHVAGIYLISVYGLIRHVIADPAPPVMKAFVTQEDPVKPQPRPLEELRRQPLADNFRPTVAQPAPQFQPELVEPADAGIALRFEDTVADAGNFESRVPLASTPLTFTARRSSDDYYPAISIRLGEEGATTLRVCVGADGALQGAPQVSGSSGHARLDAAAVNWARDALVFRPATEGGGAVGACKGFRVSFMLRQ
jgi:periplasmic protein TonB